MHSIPRPGCSSHPSARRVALLALSTLVALATVWLPSPAAAQVSLSIAVRIAPPPLPVYVQPPMPGPGYLWQPGYWAWDPDLDDYYWVPGTWVEPPETGLLWTPGYWAWSDGGYYWHPGYWGLHVGFYGGIIYGFGYIGVGYAGGYWEGSRFFYNRACNNIPRDVDVRNVYYREVVHRGDGERVSFNGGAGGIRAAPTREELRADRERHLQPLRSQLDQQRMARSDPALRASVNHGHPQITATPRPGQFAERAPATTRGGEPRRPEAHGSPRVIGSEELRNRPGQFPSPPRSQPRIPMPRQERPAQPSYSPARPPEPGPRSERNFERAPPAPPVRGPESGPRRGPEHGAPERAPDRRPERQTRGPDGPPR